jgi:hypothetical protein
VIEEEEVVKKPRKSRKTASPVVEVPASSSVVLGLPVAAQAEVIVAKEEVDAGAEAEVEDEATPVCFPNSTVM